MKLQCSLHTFRTFNFYIFVVKHFPVRKCSVRNSDQKNYVMTEISVTRIFPQDVKFCCRFLLNPFKLISKESLFHSVLHDIWRLKSGCKNTNNRNWHTNWRPMKHIRLCLSLRSWLQKKCRTCIATRCTCRNMQHSPPNVDTY